jgi:hypothetical protein
MSDYCEGCLTYNYEDGSGSFGCTHDVYNVRGQCPCTGCIVKVMCTLACVEFDDFRDKNLADLEREGR